MSDSLDPRLTHYLAVAPGIRTDAEELRRVSLLGWQPKRSGPLYTSTRALSEADALNAIRTQLGKHIPILLFRTTADVHIRPASWIDESRASCVTPWSDDLVFSWLPALPELAPVEIDSTG